MTNKTKDLLIAIACFVLGCALFALSLAGSIHESLPEMFVRLFLGCSGLFSISGGIHLTVNWFDNWV